MPGDFGWLHQERIHQGTDNLQFENKISLVPAAQWQTAVNQSEIVEIPDV